MSYTTDPAEHAARAAKLLEKMDASDLRPATEPELGDWTALRAELETLAASAPATWQGGSVQAFLAVYGTDLGQVWFAFRDPRAAARARAAHAAELAQTYQMEPWTGGRWGKAKRLPKTEAAWARKGHVLVERPLEVRVAEDNGNDNLSFGAAYKVRSVAIGAEIDEGTVASKRIIRRPASEGGSVVQYLVKPYSAAAQARRVTAKRIEEIRYQLGANLDYQTPESIAALNAELRTLEALA